MLRLSDPADLERAGQTCETMSSISNERRVWRELVQTHFTKVQVEYVLENNPRLRESKDWKRLYQTLRRRYGLREEFTEVVTLCRKCSALFWQSLGHPCFVPDDSISYMDFEDNFTGKEENTDASLYISLSPQAFLSFFSV